MRPVIIESPYAGDVESNIEYAKECIKHSLSLGEAPFASHLLYTQVLNDDVVNERCQGMEAGFAWGKVAQYTVVYCDRGVTDGMREGIKRAVDNGHVIEYRRIK